MPIKSRKKTDKLDKVIAIVKGHTKQLDAHTKLLDGHTKRLDSHTKRFDDLTRRLDGHTKRLDRLTKETRANRTAIDRLREETRADRKKLQASDKRLLSHLLRLAAEQDRRFKELEQVMHKYWDRIATAADFMRKDYDVFKQERLVMGAVLDRHQKEIDRLKESDSRQDQTIENLNGRVLQLEKTQS